MGIYAPLGVTHTRHGDRDEDACHSTKITRACLAGSGCQLRFHDLASSAEMQHGVICLVPARPA